MLANAPVLLTLIALICAVVGIATPRYPLIPVAVILLSIAVLLITAA